MGPWHLDTLNPLYYRLIAFNGRYIHSNPALFYVRGTLESNIQGCRTEIIQFTVNDPYYQTLRRITAGEPGGLFFSVYIWSSRYIERLVRDLVKIMPETPVILGGPQAGTMARDLHDDTRRKCTVISGEIEGVGDAFYRDLLAGDLQPEYRGSGNKMFSSPYRPEDFSGPLKNRYVYYESSRGCPFNCTYCLSSSEKGVRHLPVPQVRREIADILRHNPRIIRFVDRTFNDIPERALDIWRFLAEQPGDTLFHFEMAPDRFTEAMLAFLARVEPGRFQFEIGVQATNPETLAAINRKCDPIKLRDNITGLASLDTIHLHLDLILGLPYETRESYGRSFAEVFALGPHYIQMGLLKILPGTPISRDIAKFGLVACEEPPYEVLANRWLAREELAELYWFGECAEAFYNNRFFRQFWKHLRRTGEDILVFFQGLSAICQKKGFFDAAKTQELLSSLLYEAGQDRPDQELLRELLVFDWLRCGHRFLPDHLAAGDISRLKKNLWKKLPQNLEGFYDHRSRDEFFKQGVFAEFTGSLLRAIGLANDDENAIICFQPEREDTVFRLNRYFVLPVFSRKDDL